MSKAKRLAGVINGRVTSFLDRITVVSEVLRMSRISAIVVLGGAVILLANDQGREITVHMGRSLGAELIYFLAVTFWAAQAWFWARLVLTATYGTARGAGAFERMVVNHVPRILGTAAFVITAIAFYQAGSYGLATLCVLAGIAFYAVVLFRRVIMRVPPSEPADNITGAQANARDFGVLLPIMIALSATVILAGTVLSLVSPVRFGTLLGGGTVAFLALGSIIPVGSTLNMYAVDRRFPLVTVLLVLLAVFSLTNDNHLVRQLPEVPLRAEPEQEFNRWAARLPAPDSGTGQPFVIVTTAGGGLRAAYWTSTILGAVQDHVPHFSDHLFAISGVSGGSLGATIFTSLLAERDLITCDNARPPLSSCFEQAGQDVLSRDFLGPTIMSLLYTDLMQSFLPVPLLPDRAQALENSWAKSWDENLPARIEGRLKSGFTSLWRNAELHGNWVPALLLNGTLREDGKRVLTSHLRIGSDIFPSTYDFFELHCDPSGDVTSIARDVPVVTAIMNSTRFPYLTPAGTLSNCHQTGINHILDGGYFENFGAVTALDMLNWAVGEAERTGVTIRPIVVQIVSNPVSPLAQEFRPFQIPAKVNGHAVPAYPPGGSTFLSELLSPIDGIFETRNARGVLAAVHLRNRVSELASDPPSSFIQDPLYVRMELETVRGYSPPSLGWVLSETSRALIRDQLICITSNRTALVRLLTALGADESVLAEREAGIDCQKYTGLE